MRTTAELDYIAAWKAISAVDGRLLEIAGNDGFLAGRALRTCFRNARLRFESGNGLITVSHDLSDNALRIATKIALKFGHPFVVTQSQAAVGGFSRRASADAMHPISLLRRRSSAHERKKGES